MKNIHVLLFAALLFVAFVPASASAQNTIVEHKVKWMEGDQNALVITITANTDDVEDALKLRLKSEGLKPSSKKGFLTCMESNWSRIGSGTMDFYFKITKVDKEKSEVAFFISKGYSNFLTSDANKTEIENAKAFLQNLVVDVKRFQLNRSLDQQAKKIKDALEEQEKLAKAQKKMEADLEELNKKIAVNKDDQEAKKKELENLKNQLKELQDKLDELK